MRLSTITIVLALAIGLFLIAVDGSRMMPAAALPVFISLLGLARQHWLRSTGAALMLAVILLSIGLLYIPVFVLMCVQVFRAEKENYV